MLSRHTDPIAAIATASGRGAVGIVRVSGAGLEKLALALCGRVPPARVATLLNFCAADGSVIDQGLAIFFPAPHSYTGEDVLELHGHGGAVVLQLLLARVLEAGAEIDALSALPRLTHLRVAEPGEFSQRAFLNDKMDLAQAEAIADLIDASTEAAARSASRSLAGEFSQEIHRLRDALVRLRMLVEATLDFPEEEIDFLKQADAQGQLDALERMLQAVLARTRQGALLREGITVVIAGQPNAGKSSLLNALAGAELAIVTPIAGTTRDKVAQTIQIGGVPLHVIDTAGLRDSDDEVEKIGIARAWTEVEAADAVLFLHDLTRAQEPQYAADEARLEAMFDARVAAHVPVLDVWNKIDMTPVAPSMVGKDAPPATEHKSGPERDSLSADSTTATPRVHQQLLVSAKTGVGLEDLRQALLHIAGWQAPPEGVFLARTRHVHALQRVATHLGEAQTLLALQAQALDLLAEELRLAQNALNEITGEFTSDDLLGVIFSRFCIGK